MSLAVEQSLPSSEVEVGLPQSESHRSPALPLINMDAVPSPATGRGEACVVVASASASASACAVAVAVAAAAVTTTTKSASHRSSYATLRSQYFDAMDHQIITTPTSADGHVVDCPEAPMLPQKSALRASRMLDGLVGLKFTAPADTPAFTQTPHDEYLSSEEEASSTTDDCSDFEYDSGSDDQTTPSPVSEGSKHQVTARVVSVIFSGKPSMIQVPQNRRSISPTSIEQMQKLVQLQQETSNESDVKSRRRMSTSTVSSRASSRPDSRITLPPRSSSMQPPGASRPNLPFLTIDPYANGSTYSLGTPLSAQEPQELQEPKSAEDQDRPKTPKTPTKMFKGVARAMSLMKRKSTPRMNQAFLAPSEASGRPTSPSTSSIPEEADEPREVPASSPSRAASPLQKLTGETEPAKAASTALPPSPPSRPPPRPQLQPITHDEIVRLAEKNARMNKHKSVNRAVYGEHMLDSPISPMSPLTTPSPLTPSKRASAFGFGRRRMSMKLTGKLQV
ncbi:hypothetical protein BD289DRAFT_426603 [Coniella lustricola]|uniref:Uncharacterized protein n=1 Tax=Coniella lustricola TaxID=2025994 RepID=A0A2T3AG46_9PEZI|nr:hypothetical protein BD289DRAFT_426603 [Coniella lustricola]